MKRTESETQLELVEDTRLYKAWRNTDTGGVVKRYKRQPKRVYDFADRSILGRYLLLRLSKIESIRFLRDMYSRPLRYSLPLRVCKELVDSHRTALNEIAGYDLWKNNFESEE